MQNLRIVNVEVVDISDINVTFTAPLTPNLVPANVSIVADTPNVPNATVVSVSVNGPVLKISCQPLTPLASYYLVFQSTPDNPFQSLNGEAIIMANGVSNQYLISAPIGPDNPIYNYLINYFSGNIYEGLQDPNSVVTQYINSLATNLARALYDIRQLKTDNYLELDVIDEQKVRGGSPFDRLNNEGAYEVDRVATGPTDAVAAGTISFADFPYYAVTLQRELANDTLTASSVDSSGIFNINSLTLNLANAPVTRVNSIVFTLSTANPVYTYNISDLGYQIQNSRYDQDYGFTYPPLAANQIRLNDLILSDPLFSLDNILQVSVGYEYKDEGIVVDATTVKVTTVNQSIREVLPPIINVFSLQNAPITDNTGVLATFGGVTFTDPNQATPGALHPAFLQEIPFRLQALPSVPGTYAIDYSVGQVYVYGANLTNDGTGPEPPLATYYYLFTYIAEQDYAYDPTSYDLIALGPGNLTTNPGTISFNYEQVLIPGIDYTADCHIEVLNESVNNNLTALNVLKTQQSPITNVFQIFNETSGEIYSLVRWDGDRVYFKYNNPPNIASIIGERAAFNVVPNELLFVNTTTTNSNHLRIFKLLLNNNTLVAGTEDTIGSFFNTSVNLSDGNVFVIERWFSREFDEPTNLVRLVNQGDYMIDYTNGILYVVASANQQFNIGSITYKNDQIVPLNPNVVTVNDIYYRISPLQPKNSEFSYDSFGVGSIVPSILNPSDEMFLNNNTTAPYLLINNNVGVFVETGFVPGVTYQVKFVRSVFEYDDLLYSTNPINFATAATSSNFNINVGSLNKQSFDTVQFDGTNYYILLNENIPFLSPNITFNFTIIRVADNTNLWNTPGTIVPGNPLKLILSSAGNPHLGDLVSVVYSFTINNISRVVVDYNKGDYFIDYSYVADQILVSYEYGDNQLDFRNSNALSEGDIYYCSYKAGALRNTLLQNFGTLVNVPELANVDLNFNRQRYREALQAALSSFIQGPTVAAIKNIGFIMSHIEPEVIESAFQAWTLGTGLLNPEPIETTGDFTLLPAKFGNGVLVNQPGQTISFPANSNLRLEAGTWEAWVSPQWNGLDNYATLTFNIKRNGQLALPKTIFIGASEYHPEIVNGTFFVNKFSEVQGKPNLNKDGIFIYYDKDYSGNFSRWYVQVVDDGYSYGDGYADGYGTYQFIIQSSGTIYDNKSTVWPKPSNVSTFTGINTINLTINGTGVINSGITFLADPEHYLMDLGEGPSSRLSIYKDASGYMNFRAIDKNKQQYTISYDISSWLAGQLHQVAASWKLNTINNQDEMHFFIDGFEVPNIIKYGQKLQPYLHEKFRTVDPEEFVGLSDRDIIGSDDLITTAGSPVVSSSINFTQYNIFDGDTIIIDEIGFNSFGYTIENINGQQLTLNAPMPITLTNGRFSINRTSYVVTSEINVVPNIAVSTIHAFLEGTDGYGSMGSNYVSSLLTNFSAQEVQPGYMIRLDNASLPLTFVILQVTGNTLMISEPLPINVSPVAFQIYSNTETELPGVRALLPDYSISQDANLDNILTISNGVFANDLILLRTLGLNFKSVDQKYYVWSDEIENIIRTQLPPPISLDEVNITKLILNTTAIGPSNSTLMGGIFVSNNLSVNQPSNSQNGRSLTAVIAGTNADFSSPVQVTINGVNSSFVTITETISFTDYGTLNFTNSYVSVNYIQVNAKPINSITNSVTVQVREMYPITYSEFSSVVPIIKYSYHIGGGYGLYNDTPFSVRDNNNTFSGFDVGNYLLIQSPNSVAGFYLITGLSEDRHSIEIQATAASFPLPLANFTNGIYQILKVTQYRSGLQNGMFIFEIASMPGTPYLLHSGWYEFNYNTYASIKFQPLNTKIHIGTDFAGNHVFNGIINEMKIYSVMLTDTRVGETSLANQRTITKDFNSLKPLQSDVNTLMLVNFNNQPFTNLANFYATLPSNAPNFQSQDVVNDNFGQSLVITNNPLVVNNFGILDTQRQGTIEFWMNPLFDTSNDPNYRYYFDAYGAVLEETTSVNDVSVKITGSASKILSVKTQIGDQSIDYFAGGKLEIDTQRAVQEETVSINAYTVSASQPILQVITVKIAGDLTGMDYFQNGSIGSDGMTIYLGQNLPLPNLPLIVTYQSTANLNNILNTQVIRLNRKLPNQNTPVVVNYIPKGLQGDRISIFKDPFGYMNFLIHASGTDFVLRAPVLWARNTWHRVKATYQFNGGFGNDNMMFFLDGYQWTDVPFGSGTMFGTPNIWGQAVVGDGYGILGNITFKDSINELYIGSDYTGNSPIFSLIDNLRISNLARPVYAPYGEPLDVNYTNNLSVALPVTQDLYTTYLLNFDSSTMLNSQFATIKNRKTGLFDFTVNILDSFGIVSSSILVQDTLNTLINTLKPANSRAFIQYIT